MNRQQAWKARAAMSKRAGKAERKAPLIDKGKGKGKVGKKGSGGSPPLAAVALGVAGVVAAALFYRGGGDSTQASAGGSATAGGSFDSAQCGPVDNEHFSELPARGLHILTLAEGDRSCAVSSPPPRVAWAWVE